jgi:hypothetical protein
MHRSSTAGVAILLAIVHSQLRKVQSTHRSAAWCQEETSFRAFHGVET